MLYRRNNKKLLETVLSVAKQSENLNTKLIKCGQQTDKWTDGHNQSISQNCFAIRPIKQLQYVTTELPVDPGPITAEIPSPGLAWFLETKEQRFS